MTTITVYDPAMSCSTGICGTDVDQKLVDLAADLDWLKAQGVLVQRFGLSREPAEFASNDNIRQIMQDSEGDDLSVFIIDGAIKAKARYPTRAELAECRHQRAQARDHRAGGRADRARRGHRSKLRAVPEVSSRRRRRSG